MPLSLASTHPADGLAIAMLLVLCLAFGTVFLILRSILVHHRRTEGDIDRLLREAGETASSPAPRTAPPAPRSPAREAWERDADWWRQSGS